MKCENCGWDYPAGYLAPFTTKKKQVENCCGICALSLSNEARAIFRKRFDTPMAEEMRQNALKWRASIAKEAGIPSK